MRSKIVRLLVFVLLVVASDKIIGRICEKLYYKSNDYNIHRLRYTLDSTREDILILGSSRAQYHFIPSIIDQNTGLRSYNCGFGGEGLVFSFIQLKESLKRYKPRLVVLEVSPNILIDPESQQKLKILMPFSKKDPLIYDALTKEEMTERVKLMSSIYPYNSTIASLITGRYKPNVDTTGGFMPLQGVIDTIGINSKINVAFPSTSIPQDRLDVLKQFITTCTNSNIKLLIVVSPVYQANQNLDEMTQYIETTCKEYNKAYFLNYSKLEGVHQNPLYFKDNLHLNYDGAKVFSEVVSKKFKEIIDQQSTVSIR
jgi:hypothetical protein